MMFLVKTALWAARITNSLILLKQCYYTDPTTIQFDIAERFTTHVYNLYVPAFPWIPNSSIPYTLYSITHIENLVYTHMLGHAMKPSVGL